VCLEHESRWFYPHTYLLPLVYPVLQAPGYSIRSIDERSLVYFADNPRHLLKAYADCGEGVDRAGGFAIQVGLNSILFFPYLIGVLRDSDPF